MPRRASLLLTDEFAGLCGARIVPLTQLEGLGLGRSTVRYRCRPGGPWRSVLPGIVMLSNAAPDRDDHRAAALLYAGPGSVITGIDALQLHGMQRMPNPSGPIHVLVPADRRRAGAGRVLVERTGRLPAPAPGRWPLAPVERAALDFARRSRDRDAVRATIAEVVQRGRCTVAELVHELALGSGRGSALPREVLAEVGDGVRSVAEAKARKLVHGMPLPVPIWNPRLVDMAGRFIAIPDAWFDDVAMAWEIDSREWHLSPEDYDRTVQRRSAMMGCWCRRHAHPTRQARPQPRRRPHRAPQHLRAGVVSPPPSCPRSPRLSCANGTFGQTYCAKVPFAR